MQAHSRSFSIPDRFGHVLLHTRRESHRTRRLLAVGVESYLIDLATGRETFYMTNGSTHSEIMTLPLAAIAEDFSTTDIVAAIRGAQSDTVRYPEFVKLARAAGITAYWAFLTGKKVIYFGRKGEMHIEEFPK